MRRSSTLLTGALLPVLLLIGPLYGRDGRVSQDFHYSYDLQPGGHLDLTNANGSVEITGWDRSTIDVSGTKYGATQSDLDAIQVKVDVHGSEAKITTVNPQKEWWHGGGGVHYRIHLPTRIRLDRLQTTNGSVTAENLEGGGRVNSTNGKLVLTRLRGDYTAATTNGSIDWQECSGDETAETTNGSVRGRHKSGSISAGSTNGSINLTVDQPSNHKQIRLSTTNGSITLALAEYHDNAIKAETTHGAVTLRLPQDTNAHLNAETSMASVSSHLPLSSEQRSKHELHGQLGKGGPEILASSSMGSIRVERY